MTKLYKIESQFFAVRFLHPSSSKHNFTVLLKNTAFELLSLQNLNFYCYCTLPKDLKKFFAKRCQTITEKYFTNFIFPKNDTLLCFQNSNTILAWLRKTFKFVWQLPNYEKRGSQKIPYMILISYNITAKHYMRNIINPLTSKPSI